MKDQYFGALGINWETRKEDWYGMDGCGENMTAEEVVELLHTNKDNKNETWYGLIFWTDNGQLSVHDLGGFAEETGE